VYEAFVGGEWELARSHQDLLLQLVLAVRAGVFPAAIKAALDFMGVCEPWPAPPVPALGERARAQLREQLLGWGILAPIGSRHG